MLRDAPEACAPEVPSGIRSFSAEELRRILHSHPTTLTLVDVRDPHEYAAGHLPGSLHIPLAELPARIDELRGRQAVTFLCLSGVRSQRACAIAAAAGLAQLGHLEGGLRSWQMLPAPLHYSS
jgi:rhodanese-related sulfurtransferase